jgi:hypothetical protein
MAHIQQHAGSANQDARRISLSGDQDRINRFYRPEDTQQESPQSGKAGSEEERMKQAALDKFWEALEKVKDREWHLSERGCIRALSCFCPLEVIGPHGYYMV